MRHEDSRTRALPPPYPLTPDTPLSTHTPARPPQLAQGEEGAAAWVTEQEAEAARLAAVWANVSDKVESL